MEIIILLVGIANWFFGGFVLMSLWNWIPATVFEIPQIGYTAGLGLLIFSLILKKVSLSDNKATKDEQLAFVLSRSIHLVIALFLGFLVSAFLSQGAV